MKRILLIFLSAVSGLIFPLLSKGAEADKFLMHLDSLIESQPQLEESRSRSVRELWKQRNSATTEEDRYWANNRLYEAYYIHNADSAMSYVDENMVLARDHNDTERLNDLKIKKAFLYIASGMLNQAQDLLKSIDSSTLPHSLKKDYYGQMIYLYGLLGNYAGISSENQGWNHYYDIEQTYKDSLLTILTPEDNGYLWYKGWSAQGLPREGQDSVMTLLRNAVDNSDLNSREDAQIAYVLAVLYREAGNSDKYLEYMAKSAIADVKIGNREIASLQELAKNRFLAGDINRAYDYIEYCLDAALKYPNRVRALTLLPIQNEINGVYQQRLRDQETRTRGFLIAVCVLAAILAGAITLIFVQLRKLKHSNRNILDANELLHLRNEELEETRKELGATNTRLKELNEKLSVANENLREVNYVKEEYVGYVFSICSLYIKKMEDLRRSINMKAKKKLWKEIEEQTTHHQTLAKEELKEFYENFDSIFLHIYPDFVSDFNSLLLPEEKILLKEGERLNTDLRIYALVRLGITDSVKIAEFLHVSPQTVYNYRFKTRNKAAVPKENFAEMVKNLGKVNLQ